jgi:hypothetical protein
LLASITFYTAALASGIASVAARALSFFMGHCRKGARG